MRRRFVEVARRAEIVSLINASASESDLGLRFAEELCEVFDAEIAFVAEDGGERNDPRAIAAVGIDFERAKALVAETERIEQLWGGRAVLLAGDDLLGAGVRHAILASFRGEDGRGTLVGVGRLYDTALDETDRSLVEAVTLAVGHALERFWANDARNRTAAQQTALVRASKSMGRSLDTKEVLQTLCEEVQRALECTNVVAMLGDELDGYVSVGAAGMDEGFLGFRQPPGDGLGGRAVRAGRVLVTHNYQEEGYAPKESPYLVEIRSCVSAPLRWDGEFRAFVSAGFEDSRPIAVRDVELMEGFAELAALACANAARHARVQNAAQVDGLTGCLNRDALDTYLVKATARSTEDGKPLSLALIDLDRFKGINDVFGHPSGDSVLQKVGSAVRSSLRAGDMVARYGGDEFALILPNASESEAQPVIDRVRAAIRSLDAPGGRLTACVGLAERADGETASDLVRRADEALRAAKLSAGPGSVKRATTLDFVPQQQNGQPPGSRRHRWRAIAGDIGLSIARSNDLEEGAAICANELQEVLDVPMCSVLRLVSGGKLEPVAESASGTPLPGDAEGHATAEQALHEKRPILGGRATSRRNSDDDPRSDRAAEVAVPLIVNTRPWGAIRCLGMPEQFDEADAELVSAVGDHLAAAIRTADLNQRLTESMIGTAEALAAALEAKDSYTADHARSIAELAVDVGRELSLPETLIEDLRYAGIFHDLGKIAMPDSLINKPGPLTDEEWEIVKRHPAAGAEILAPVPFFYGVRTIVRHAHEHWNGGGYPDGLAGVQIPLGARIVLAADAYHAMTSDRPYRKQMSPEDAAAELKAGAGAQFDPEVVEALLAVLERREAGVKA